MRFACYWRKAQLTINHFSSRHALGAYLSRAQRYSGGVHPPLFTVHGTPSALHPFALAASKESHEFHAPDRRAFKAHHPLWA